MVTFKYRQEKTGILGEKTSRPVATVLIKGKDNVWHRFEPYIDSGADVSLISLSTGQFLGFKPEDGKKSTLGGISGGVPVIYTKVSMKLDDFEFEVRVAWAQIHGAPPLLGRADIFDNFNITFKEKQGLVVFEKAT